MTLEPMALTEVDFFQLPIAATGFAWGSRYGLVDRLHPNGHRGTDLMAVAGTPISAIAHGTIRAIGFSSCLGWYLVLEHLLRNGTHVFSGYNHMRSRPLGKVGAKLVRGHVLGYVGTTGSCTTGNHLHLTLGSSVNSNSWDHTIDPREFIESHDVDPGPKPAKTPLGRKSVTVKSGDTLLKIARAAGYASLGPIVALNPQIKDVDKIKVGDKVRVR